MSAPFIVDAHAHDHLMGQFVAEPTGIGPMLAIMDRLRIRLAVSTSQEALALGGGLAEARRIFEQSRGRIYYLGVFDPNRAAASLTVLREAVGWPGFAGLKLHPPLHAVMADDPRYRSAWEFAAEHDLTILTHSWSLSDYNPSQRFATPERFEGCIRDFPGVRFVLGHAGGRGTGRAEAVRLANRYPNVYLDIAGDIYCRGLIEELAATVPAERILFGSDYPMMDPRSNLTRVLLAAIGTDAKRLMLADNAIRAYRLEERGDAHADN
ncbi:MAG: amidohydrolase family protein [Kiritimatiellae bacterium]|nr:amidohydrolase family protein [Kiritimatiellia bacterium]